MKKLILNFPLHKPVCYFPTIFVLVTIIAMCNNYFFYRNKDIQTGLEIENTQKIITSFYESCLEFSSEAQCKSQLINSINQTWGKGQITILDHNQNEILDLNRENYKDFRNTISREITVGHDTQKISIFSSRLSSPPPWQSTWNTMTFSVLDIIDKLMKGDFTWFFITSVVLPRSSAAIYAYFTIGLVIGLFLLALKTMQRHRQILESRLNKHVSRRENLENEQQELILKLGLGEQSIQSLYESKAQLSREKQEIWDEYLKLDKELTDVREKEKEDLLLLQLQPKLKAENPSEVSSDLKAEMHKILLKNPNIKLQPKAFRFDAGFHHGQDWVGSFCESMLKDEKSSRLILEMNTGKFVSSRKGKAKIKYENNHWKLLIYDFDSDKGLCVEAKLTASTYAEAVLITKYLTTIGKFKSEGQNLELSDHDFATMGASRS